MPNHPAQQRGEDSISACFVASMLGRVTPAPASQAAQAAQEEDADLLDSEVEEVMLNYHGASGQGHKATCQVQDLWHARVTSLREHGGQVSGVKLS